MPTPPKRSNGPAKFVVAKRRGRWEYAGRARDIRAAVILALDAGEVLLVEQYRPDPSDVTTGVFCEGEAEPLGDGRRRGAVSPRR